MRPRPITLTAASGVLLVAGITLTASPTPARVEQGLTYSWVGSSGDPQADDHSWTDRRNWQPKGVPGDGDAVNIVSPQSGPCDIHVDRVPTGVTLANLLLSTSITDGCRASISGGSITIDGTLLWTGGTIDTPITIADGSGAQLGDEPVPVVERLLQPFVVAGGGLMLASADLRLRPGGSVTAQPGSDIRVTSDSDLSGPRCCAGPPTFVNQGDLALFGSTLRLASISFDQQGEVALDGSSTLVMTHGALRSRDGARYVGPGRLVMSDGTEAVVAGEQSLADGVHLELGTAESERATLDGSATLTGQGTVDWTGGTIGASLVLSPGVGLHAFGDAGGQILSGRDTRHPSARHDILSHGPVLVDDGADITMKRHALLSVAAGGSLTLAPGTQILGRTRGLGGEIRVSDAPVAVPADVDDAGPVRIDEVAYTLMGGETNLAPGSQLQLSGRVRGSLAGTALTGGGLLSIAAPMDVTSALGLEDGAAVRLLPGGALDGTAVYTGDGSFEWLGGELSGNDVAFALNDLTVGGGTTKSIEDDDGFTSFVQVINPVTFAAGTASASNTLDLNGNAFESFVGCTLSRNVELRDGVFASSQGALVVQAGHGGQVVTGTDLQLFSSGPLTFMSGTLVSKGSFTQTDGAAEVRADASLRLPDAIHPLRLQGGSLTGEGTVFGDIVNSAGVLDPLVDGGDRPLGLRGSYVQDGTGRLVLDLSVDSVPVRFGGAVSVQGTVTYDNMVGYSPTFGDERVVLTAGGDLSWAPSCEETMGTRSAHGHWLGETEARSLLATFEKGSGGSCQD